MNRALLLSLFAAAPLASCGGRDTIRVGSKNFTESLLLGELYAQLLEGAGQPVTRKLNLGTTDIAMAALQRGEIDLYPEYTGTALLDVLKAPSISDPARSYAFVRDAYAQRFGLVWLRPAPMNNTQALATTQALAARYGLRTLSDVSVKAQQLRLGAPPEFVKRLDGLPGLRRVYGGFAFKDIRLIDAGLRYQALLNGDVDMVVAFGTDGAIIADKLAVIVDDKHLFPPYQVAPVVRKAALDVHPTIAKTLDRVAPLLTDNVMRTLNNEIDGRAKREPSEVARDFIKQHGLA